MHKIQNMLYDSKEIASVCMHNSNSPVLVVMHAEFHSILTDLVRLDFMFKRGLASISIASPLFNIMQAVMST